MPRSTNDDDELDKVESASGDVDTEHVEQDMSPRYILTSKSACVRASLWCDAEEG